MQADKLKDKSIQTRHTRLEKEEREEVDSFIRYALQARNASKALQEANHDSNTKSS